MKYCERVLNYRGSERTTLRSIVENAMAPLISHRKARVAETARQIDMSLRTLARKPSSEGLNGNRQCNQ